MKKEIFGIGLAALMLTACGSGEEEPGTIPSGTTTVEFSTTTTTVTTTAAAATTAEETTAAEVTAAPEDIEIPEDYRGRFCDWYYDEDAVITDESGFAALCPEGTVEAAKRCALDSSDEVPSMTNAFRDGDFWVFKDDSGNVTGQVYNDDRLFDEKGVPQAVFAGGIYDDLDGDGSKEAVIMIDVPSFDWVNYSVTYAVLVNDSGASRITSGVCGRLVPIRYGGFTHIGLDFGANIGSSGAYIYALEDGVPVLKHEGFSLGAKEGLMMNETMAQCPYNWLVYWDNIDGKYYQAGPESVSDEIAEKLANSPVFAEKMPEYEAGFDYTSPEEIKSSGKIFGGKYVTFAGLETYDVSGGEVASVSGGIYYTDTYGCETKAIDIAAAEKSAVPADSASAEYTLDPSVKFNKDYLNEVNKPMYIGSPEGTGANVYAVRLDGSRSWYHKFGKDFSGNTCEYVIIEHGGTVDEVQALCVTRYGEPFELYAGDYDGDGETEIASVRYAVGGTFSALYELAVYDLADGHYQAYTADNYALAKKYIAKEVIDNKAHTVTFNAGGEQLVYDASWIEGDITGVNYTEVMWYSADEAGINMHFSALLSVEGQAMPESGPDITFDVNFSGGAFALSDPALTEFTGVE